MQEDAMNPYHQVLISMLFEHTQELRLSDFLSKG